MKQAGAMESTTTNKTELDLAFEMLADMILSFIAKKERRAASPEVREALMAIMEKESEDQLDHEMMSQLLNTAEYRQIA